MDDLDPEVLEAKLASLKLAHRDLDDAISALQQSASFNLIQLQRLKKRKLALQDETKRIEDLKNS